MTDSPTASARADASIVRNGILPYDILAEIFSHMLFSIPDHPKSDIYEYDRQLQDLEYVCVHWRDTAAGTSSLWTQIQFHAVGVGRDRFYRRLARTSLYFQRSKQKPLCITLSGGDSRLSVFAFWREAIPHASRIRELRIHGHLEITFFFPIPIRLPILENWSISGSSMRKLDLSNADLLPPPQDHTSNEGGDAWSSGNSGSSDRSGHSGTGLLRLKHLKLLANIDFPRLIDILDPTALESLTVHSSQLTFIRCHVIIRQATSLRHLSLDLAPSWNVAESTIHAFRHLESLELRLLTTWIPIPPSDSLQHIEIKFHPSHIDSNWQEKFSSTITYKADTAVVPHPNLRTISIVNPNGALKGPQRSERLVEVLSHHRHLTALEIDFSSGAEDLCRNLSNTPITGLALLRFCLPRVVKTYSQDTPGMAHFVRGLRDLLSQQKDLKVQICPSFLADWDANDVEQIQTLGFMRALLVDNETRVSAERFPTPLRYLFPSIDS